MKTLKQGEKNQMIISLWCIYYSGESQKNNNTPVSRNKDIGEIPSIQWIKLTCDDSQTNLFIKTR